LSAKTKSAHGTRHVTPAGRSVMLDLFSPEDAVDLECRATLLRGLERWLSASDLTQTEAAKTLGVTQARISDLKRGKISQFSLGLLVRLATRAGLKPRITLQGLPERKARG
jgi:predicted XRE-type DNA-binding protein